MELSATQALHQAVAAHKEGNLPAAERYYLAILQSQSLLLAAQQNITVYALACNNLGFVLQHRGELDAAIDHYRQAVRIKPDYHEAFYNLGIALQLTGALQPAIDNYQQAVKIKPDYAEAYYNLGHALQEQGDLKTSVACYQLLARLRPDSADVFNALGAALQLDGDLEAAIANYRQALALNPAYFEAYNNIGSALQARGDLDAAIQSCKQALEIKPDYANAYNNIGHALYDKGDMAAAIDSYTSALKIMPDSAETYNNLGNAMRASGRYAEAIENFDQLDGPAFRATIDAQPSKPQFWLNARSQALECLYILGRYAELKDRLQAIAASGDINRRVSAVSAFVTHQLKIEDRHSFCNKPLQFLHVGNLSDHIADVDSFTAELIEESAKQSQVWEPQHGVTKFGFHTANTIFSAGEHYAALEAMLRKEIAAYHARFSTEDCALINSWPAAYNLKGWFCRLVKNGHQRSHIHPAGWLSGVVYLKTIDAPDTDEGAIELGLHGYDLPILDAGYPRQIHRPRRGDILLFPSSLFHRTIPFSADTERCAVAFDMHRA